MTFKCKFLLKLLLILEHTSYSSDRGEGVGGLVSLKNIYPWVNSQPGATMMNGLWFATGKPPRRGKSADRFYYDSRISGRKF